MMDSANTTDLSTASTSSILGAANFNMQRFQIKKWNGVVLWDWNIVVDICAICRNHIMDPCIECQASNLGILEPLIEECEIAWGACNHAFHFHCISQWLKQRPVCPLDNVLWHVANEQNGVTSNAQNQRAA